MLQMLRTHLEGEGVFSGAMSPHLSTMTEVVLGDVAYNMKLSIAVSELMLYASQFRKYIKLPEDKTAIPINTIAFVLAASGANKDRTVKAIRSALSKGYHTIDIFRKQLATNAAIQAAKANGAEEPEKWENHKEFFKTPGTLFAAMTNSPAYLDHLAHIESLPVGAGYLYTGELGSEMETNADMIPSIRVMSELYDVGYKEAKPLKNKEQQTPEIKNLAVSALFIGSHENILFDEKIKSLFKKEFSTKLARRSFFTFCPEEIEPPVYSSVSLMLATEQAEKDAAQGARDAIDDLSEAIANCNLSNGDPVPLTLDPDAMDIYNVYLRYNTEVARRIDKRFPISMIVRKHAHWKALKLAGAFAIFACGSTITKQDLIYAISYVELIDGDMAKFETELVKEKYEVFCDYMKSIANENGEASISLHALKKLQYITSVANPATSMKNLIELSSSYDPNGIYTLKDNNIHYQEIIRTDVIGASFVEVSGTKQERAATCATGYQYAESDFPGLGDLLALDIAFTPFKLKDGIRGRENIISGTTWLCFDVDDTPLTDEETHMILEDINHHIARTSNPDNDKKYRVIVQLDAPVDLAPREWKHFTQSVGDFLGITIDNLPQSQIFFGYADREVLSVTDGSPVDIKEHVAKAIELASDTKPPKELTAKEKSAALKTTYATFEFAFNAKHGEGSRSLYRAARKAHELGATTDEVIQIVNDISEYWDYPFPPHRLSALEEQIKQF